MDFYLLYPVGGLVVVAVTAWLMWPRGGSQ